MDLEKIIDELVYRKKALPLESTEYQLINRMLTNLRAKHAAELEEREQRKLDPRWQDLVRQIVANHPETKWGQQELHDELEAWGEQNQPFHSKDQKSIATQIALTPSCS